MILFYQKGNKIKNKKRGGSRDVEDVLQTSLVSRALSYQDLAHESWLGFVAQPLRELNPFLVPVFIPSGQGRQFLDRNDWCVRQSAILTRQLSITHDSTALAALVLPRWVREFSSGAHSILSPKLWLPIHQGSDNFIAVVAPSARAL